MRPLLDLAAALGTRSEGLIDLRMQEARDAGLEAEVGELLLMALFVTGFPAGLEAARRWGGMRTVPPQGEGARVADVAARGRESCSAVYGPQFDALVENLAELHPDLPELVVTTGYGAMMARPGLALPVRELCMVAMLVPWRAETPLYSHIRGALRVGVPPSDVEEAMVAGLEALARVAPDEGAAARVMDIWTAVRRRVEEKHLRDEET